MFNLHAVQAKFGDCLILEYGTPVSPRFSLIDGGPSKTFVNHLWNALQTIVTTKELDFTILSHVDTDHIIGLLDLFAALEEDQANGDAFRITTGGLWHNSFQRTIDPDGQITQRMQMLMAVAGAQQVAMPMAADSFFGVREGNRLRIASIKLGIPMNDGFTDDLVMPENAPANINFGNLELHVIGPNQASLDKLRATWLSWLASTERAMAANPMSLADADDSVANLSSIVVLAKCENKTILLTGDALGDHILDGLEKGGHLVDGKMHLDILKLPHHGSERNITPTFFKNITADIYLASANGRDGNPDIKVLEWIVEVAKSAGRQITIIVTNETPSTTAIRLSHPSDDFGYELIIMPEDDHSIKVELT